MTDTSSPDGILNLIAKAGWDPFAPSLECAEATRLPSAADHLTGMDRRGIHWFHVSLTLFAKFCGGGHQSWNGRRGEQLMTVAVIFVLEQATDTPQPTPDDLEEACCELRRWEAEVFKPSRARLEKANEFQRRYRHDALEPAATFVQLAGPHCASKIAVDQRRMALGAAMHEEQSLNPSDASKDAAAYAFRDIEEAVDFLTGDGSLYDFDPKGVIRLIPKRIKSAMDGYGKPTQRRDWETYATDTEERRQDPDLEAVETADEVRAVEAVIEARHGQSRAGSAQRVVLEHFLRLTEGKTSCIELAGVAGLSPRAIQEALVKEIEAVRAVLRGR